MYILYIVFLASLEGGRATLEFLLYRVNQIVDLHHVFSSLERGVSAPPRAQTRPAP